MHPEDQEALNREVAHETGASDPNHEQAHKPAEEDHAARRSLLQIFEEQASKSLARATPEQRAVIESILAKYQDARGAVGGTTPPLPDVRLPNPETTDVAFPVANIVGTAGSASIPGDVEYAGGWRVLTGHNAGHMQYRWLSAAEVAERGLPADGPLERGPEPVRDQG